MADKAWPGIGRRCSGSRVRCYLVRTLLTGSVSIADGMSKGELLIYQGKDGVTQVSVRLQDETLWLSLNQLADLFQRDKSVISRHVSNIFEEGELEPEPTVALFATVQQEGMRRVKRDVEHYNLDMIISVGCQP